MHFYNNIGIFILLAIGASRASAIGSLMESAFKQELTELRNQSEDRNYTEPPSFNIRNHVKFILFSRESSTVGDEIEPGDLYTFTVSHFSTNRLTKVLIHGFVDDIHGEMITSIRKNFLAKEDMNVIVVDWSDIACSFNYFGAALRSEDVGVYLSELIEFLVSQGTDINKFHLIGHSLGAHVAGAAGKAIRNAGMVPRITGLDPALPGFSGFNLAHRLQDTDALFVDCIHTCGGLLGFFDPICHVNFYPNGGLHPQPGCPSWDFGKCSHFRAFKFFAESILLDHKFPALVCSKISPNSRDCVQPTVYEEIMMGYPVESRTRGLYYVYTNSDFPYAPLRS